MEPGESNFRPLSPEEEEKNKAPFDPSKLLARPKTEKTSEEIALEELAEMDEQERKQKSKKKKKGK